MGKATYSYGADVNYGSGFFPSPSKKQFPINRPCRARSLEDGNDDRACDEKFSNFRYVIHGNQGIYAVSHP